MTLLLILFPYLSHIFLTTDLVVFGKLSLASPHLSPDPMVSLTHTGVGVSSSF